MTDAEQFESDYQQLMRENPKIQTGVDVAFHYWQAARRTVSGQEAQPVAFVEGDEVQRVLRWNKDVAAFNYEVGTPLYARRTVSGQEAIYQVWDAKRLAWLDMCPELFAERSANSVSRVVYAAPIPATKQKDADK
jgi:hypothetical protein